MTEQQTDPVETSGGELPSGTLASLGAPQSLGSRPKLTEVVAEDLRTSIIQRMSPGDSLPTEGQLADHYGTSSPTVRQALRVLESEGLISIRRGPHGGPVVRYPTVEDITRNVGVYMQIHGVTQSELYEARGSLESEAARLIATQQRPETLRALDEHLEAHERAIESGDRDAVSHEHLRFHDILLEASGNKAITTLGHITRLVLSSLTAQAPTQTAEVDDDDNGWWKSAAAGLQAHQEIVELIRSGDGAGTAERMTRHLGRWLEITPLSGPEEPIELN